MPPRSPRYEANLRRRQRNVEAYLAEHGTAPCCRCGCGELVNFDHDGRPRKYRPGHNFDIVAYRRELTAAGVPLADFQAAVKKIKLQKGWTWDEVAHRGGISAGHIRRLMFGKGQASVSRPWATDFLRRLAGLSAPPSTYMLKRMEQEKRAEREIDREVW